MKKIENVSPIRSSSHVVGAKSANPFGARVASAALPSPFASTRRIETDDIVLDDDAAYYQLNQGGPALAAAEIDALSGRAVEVQVLWGEYDAIHLSLLNPPRDFVIGEDGADFAMERAQLGTSRYPVTMVEGGTTYVIVPEGAEIVVKNQGIEHKRVALHAAGSLTTSDVLPGALRYRLADCDVVRVRRAGFVFQVKSITAAKRLAAAGKLDPTPAYYVGGAGMIIGALLLALSLSNPGGGTLANDGIDMENRLVQAMINPPENPHDVVQPSDTSASAPAGQRASGEEGEAGRPDRPHTGGRRANSGQVAPSTASATPDVVRNSNVLGTIASFTGSLVSQSSPFAASSAVGSDPMSVLGSVLGVNVGESGGFGGLGQRGHGLGGGDPTSEALRAGGLDTHGYGPGRGPGDRFGRDLGDDDLGPRRQTAVVQPLPTVTVAGSLPSDVIRRVIQRNIGQVRFCYEQALGGRPDLSGRVAVRFAISPTGSVQTAMVASSSLGDARVESCVASAMRRLSFPAPENGGMVMVTYPFMFSSAGQ